MKNQVSILGTIYRIEQRNSKNDKELDGLSGLWDSSDSTSAWATNEEMVDWIAIQGLKLYKAWEEAEAV